MKASEKRVHILFEIDKAPDCVYNAKHTFYVCEKWALEEVVGQQIPENFDETVLRGQQQ